ncbi:MAG: hypothetical protein DWI48_00525 [Chloroflexi bacterium]|nr:MAG: hypothetical protein DWI48_00525 [Chloroflexota bacterium]
MRFKRSDLPGLLIATVVPPLLFVLFLQSFDVYSHRGTPLLGFMATNFAIAIGILAMFTRFVRNWEVPIGLFLMLITMVGLIIWLQRLGYDGGALSLSLKWLSILDFLALNIALGYQVLVHGLLPVLDRRAARRTQ